ncbi:MAG: AAA family ATPase [Legionellales bacterium]|jgi:hypothetical protein
MNRIALNSLQTWFQQDGRKPLVLRGARQVGKTYLVREFARVNGLELIELNFEKNPEYKSLFVSNDVKKIVLLLEALQNKVIEPTACLLFLDEIQVVPELLAKLRWFAEDLPQLPVIAAGSLLDFVLNEHDFSMPVGRINYFHLEPLSFEEFLLAIGRDKLVEFLESFKMGDEIPKVLHEQLLGYLRDYFLIGGLPAAVVAWIRSESLITVNQVQQDLLATYRDDFNKYAKRINKDRLEEVLFSVPRQLSSKFVYSRVNKEIPSMILKKALDLLCTARVCHIVSSNHAQGIPLAGGKKATPFKVIFLDTGLTHNLMGLNMQQLQQPVQLMYEGAIAEQFVGQMLRTLNPYFIEPELYYWNRDIPNSSAEVDYILQQGQQLIPIEVKAGSTGTLKSLHLLMGMRQWPLAVRINSDYPTITLIDTMTVLQQRAHYKLLSLPLYLIGQLRRLIDENH